MAKNPAMDSTHPPKPKVNVAVQQALAECRNSVAPIVSLARFIDDLQADPRWNDQEIRQVETAVRQILVRIMQ